MSVIVTGGTGFLGSRVVRLLLEKGEKVVAFDLYPNEKNLADVIDKVVIAKGDLGKFSNILKVVEEHKPTAIYHLAALMSYACDADPEAGIQVNALGTYYILEAARLFGVKQVLFASSTGVLTGDNPNDKTIHDYSATQPNAVYSIGKMFSETLGKFYKRQYGLDFRGIRLPAVIGPGVTSEGYVQYFNKTIEQAAKGNPYEVYVKPEAVLAVVHVDDAARAFLDLAAAPIESIKTVNYIIMGPSPSPSAQDLADIVKSKRPDAKTTFKLDEQKWAVLEPVLRLPVEDTNARKEWGWNPKYDLSGLVDDVLASHTPSDKTSVTDTAAAK